MTSRSMYGLRGLSAVITDLRVTVVGDVGKSRKIAVFAVSWKFFTVTMKSEATHMMPRGGLHIFSSGTTPLSCRCAEIR